MKNEDIKDFKTIQRQVIDSIKPLIEISEIKPVAYIVELGSNHQAGHHLQQARMALTRHSNQTYWTTEYINPDYTATPSNPKPDYTNQCGYLQLNLDEGQQLCLGELIRVSKVIEKQIQRNFYEADKLNKLDVDSLIKSISQPTNRQVIIDIDILAIKTNSGKLIAVEERYPFKDHEWVGITELYQNKFL